MINIVSFSDLVIMGSILGSIAVLGYMFLKFEKRYKSDSQKQKFENEKVLQVFHEGKSLLSSMREENAKLQKSKENAVNVGDKLNAIISEAEAEAENGEKIIDELKEVVGSGQRVSTRLSDLISSAAQLHRSMKPVMKELETAKLKPAKKHYVSRERMKTLPNVSSHEVPKQAVGGTNIVTFPVKK